MSKYYYPLIKFLFLWFAQILLFQFSDAQTNHYKGKIGKTLADSKEYWPRSSDAKGKPNIIWILLDDVGFGASSSFGGLINTPTFDTLADQGLRYTNFHTAGICAPTRAALLTGRNHHYVHMGGFAHVNSSAGFPGYDGKIPEDKGTIAEILRADGYTTFAVGKWGLTPDDDTTFNGPFDRWPSGKGFDHFFGFLGSATDQYKPELFEDNLAVTYDGRHFSEQITDKAIYYIAKQKKTNPDKPFFLYYAPAATHAPHQVAKEWSDLYKGKFDEGWDVYREKVFQKQKAMGIVPADAKLPERNADIKAWESLSVDEKKLYARFMEVYAGYLTYTDYQISRIINYLKQINQFDNTLILVMIGDNGASKEGTIYGSIEKITSNNYNKTAIKWTNPIIPQDIKAVKVIGNEEQEYLKENVNNIDKIGTPESQTNYPLGWAQAANTPFKYWKSDANAEGATRNPLIIFYPKRIKEKGGIRDQYSHVIDILPTTLDIAGLTMPKNIKGIKQDTLQGLSLYSSINNAKASSLHHTQYYYIFGSRSIYHDGWKAEAFHHPDFVDLNDFAFNKNPYKKDYEADIWELYNLNEDFNERNDLAKKYPKKLAAMKALFNEEAKKNHIYPFIDWEDVFQGRVHKLN